MQVDFSELNGAGTSGEDMSLSICKRANLMCDVVEFNERYSGSQWQWPAVGHRNTTDAWLGP